MPIFEYFSGCARDYCYFLGEEVSCFTLGFIFVLVFAFGFVILFSCVLFLYDKLKKEMIENEI